MRKLFQKSLSIILAAAVAAAALPFETRAASVPVTPDTPLNMMVGSYLGTDYGKDVAVGNGYAYVAEAGAGLQIFGLTDLTNPKVVGNYPALTSVDHVVVSGTTAYIADSGYLKAIDVTDPTAPALLGQIRITTGKKLLAAGSDVYVVDSVPGLRIIDMSDPAHPVEKGELYNSLMGTVTTGFVSGQNAYLYDGTNLYVADVSDVTAPKIVGQLELDESAVTNMFAANGTVYLTRSSGTAAGSYTSGVMAVDVSNAASPKLSFNYSLPNTAGANALYVADGKAYVAGANFFYILDVSGSSPSILRQSVTYNGDSGSFTTNVCNALTFDGQYAYLANNFFALSVLDTTAGLKSENPDITFRDHTQAADTASLDVVPVAMPNVTTGGQSVTSSDTKPAVFRLSDAVKPGELITAYGENMTDSSVLAFSPVTDNNAPSPTLPANSTRVTVTKADTTGQSAAAVMPDSLAAGFYYVWVSNASGWSLPTALNGARPQWVSQEQSAPGLKVTVVGQNFDGTEFGAAQSAQVVLSDGTHAYRMPLNSVNPYAIQFTVSNIPAGSYDVLVSNDGNIWRKPDDNIKLSVVASVTDPLGLGVAWANDFNWTKYTVTDAAYGAKGDGSTDDSAAIQAAIDAAGAAGGGEVYLPDGSYIINQPLTLPAGVTLVGQSRRGTVVTYIHPGTDQAGSAVISMQGDAAANIGKVGLANFTLKVDPNTPFDSILWLGHGWSSALNSDQSLRTATDIFVLNMNISSAYNRLPVGRSLGELFFAKKNVLVRGSNFSGYQNTISSARSGDYVECSDNDFYTDVSNLSLGGCHYLQENNILSRNFSASQDSLNFITSQGSWTRGYAYAADNTAKNTGMPGWNEGEIIANEGYGGGTKMFGTVTAATATSLTLAPVAQSDGSLAGNAGINNWALARAYGDWYVTIISGRGLGQARKIVGLDSAGKTCTVDQPWDVQPDATSRFVINLPNAGAIFYHNTAQNCGASFIFYNYAYDSVMADNVGINTEGAVINGGSIAVDKRTDYFCRIERNTFTGGGNKSGVSETGIYADLETPDPYGTMVYGIAIKNNTIQDANDSTFLKHEHSATGTGLVISVDARVQPIAGAGNNMVRTVTIENNTVKNSTTGMVFGYGTITHSWDQYSQQYSLVGNIITRGNTLKNVGTAVINTGVEDELDMTPLSDSINLAFDQKAVSSSGSASKAVDGDDSTAWTASASSTQTLTVDLGGVSNPIDSVTLRWGSGYATAYQVQVANTNDASTVWQDAYTTLSGDGGSDDISLTDVKGRYVRLSTTASSGSEYDLSEFEVNGVPAPKLVTAKTGTDGKSIVLTFDRPLANLPASPAGFSATRGADTQALGITGATLSADWKTVTLALSDTVVYTDTDIRVSYAPGTVQTRYGGAPLGAIAGQDVANLAPIPLPQPAPIPAGTNLVRNPGFESGAASWENYGCTITPVTDSAGVHGGAKAVKVSSRTQPWTGPRQDILSQLQSSGSGQYDLSGWFKVASSTVTSAPLRVNLEYHYTVGGVSTTKNVFTDVSDPSKWPTNSAFTQMNGLVTVTIPDGATLTFAKVELFTTETASPYVEFYADDISVRKVADKTALAAAIQSAAALLNDTPVGTAVGSAPLSAHDALAAAVAAADAVNSDPVPLQTNVDSQTAALTAAIAAFHSAVKTTAAPVTVTFDATSGVQAGGTATLTATVAAADGGIPSGMVSFTVDGAALGSPVLLDDTGKAVFQWTNVPGGTHVLEVQYSGDPGYLPGTGTVASYEVSKLNQTTPLTLGGVPQSVTYGDAPFALSVSGGSGSGALSYSVSGSAVAVDADGQVRVQGAGSAVVTVTKAGDDTYNPVSASVTVTVAKAQSRIVTLPTASGVTAPATLSAAVLTGGAGSVPGMFAWSQPDAAVAEPGSYEVTFTPADAANYLPSTGMVSVSVTARRLADDTTGVQVLLPQGALPEDVALQDVRLSVTPVTGGAAFAQAQAALASAGTKFSLFDIRLYAGDTPLEPTKPVRVSLPIPDGFDTAHLALYYIKDDGTAEPVTGGSVQGGLYVFTASHFSSYALVDTSGADTSSAPSSAASSGSASSAESAGNPSTGVGTPAGAAVVVFGAAACAALLFGRRRRGRHGSDGGDAPQR